MRGPPRSTLFPFPTLFRCEIDLDGDLDGLFFAVVVEECLLRAVTDDVVAGELCKKGERRKESDGRDVRAGFGRREIRGVFVEETRKGFMAALAEEIGFADGLVGQRGAKGERGWS